MCSESGLGLRLRDEENEREACVAHREATESHLGIPSALDVENETRTRVAARDERVGKADELKDLESAGLHGQRARLTCAVQGPIDDAKPSAERPQLRREREPGRAGSHDENIDHRISIHIEAGAVERLRPKKMTVTAITAGVIPILWSEGAGGDVMKRIAAPMVGGMATSPIPVLLVLPALYDLWKERRPPGLHWNGSWQVQHGRSAR